ncbi:pimeloyl-ACP methyl ester carboxylesterase [Panacagrimonas perspica]|uniref:Pimeloyl-ACP methyl ester carboxylesterase n=1 Tax=Panacagrimonas perspica TaxID=381431 RepID=A0A4R7PDZ0_9GAMM|nr:alpha/beta hydrolase [Panacagrimonas perspica]TDU32415.1 pimeloyl-ACP methyl ester carboxylesterase [Panacagrimonas perspica]THD05340.1 alpha/beta hydrolase [Panacagrimonas perspica]
MTSDFQTRRYTGAQGLQLAADVGGDPAHPPVVMLHGGGQTRHSWGTAMRELVAQGFHVVNLDARGHSDSDWSPDADYELPTLAADLKAVIATLRSPPALVGASMGGATSLYAVGNTPEPIARALVMVDIVPRIEQAGGDKIGAFMRANPEGFATLEDAADAVAAYYPHRPRPKDPSGLMKNLRRRDDGRLHWHWDPQLFARPRKDRPPEPPRFTEQLLHACPGVHIPTLLVRGLNSDIVGDAGVAEFKQALPQLEVFDVVGAGHMVAGDRNDAFNHGVVSFLKRTINP